MLNYRGLTREFPQIGCPRSIVAFQPHAGVNATSTIWFLADCPSVRRQWPIQWHDGHLAVAMASLTHRKGDKFLAGARSSFPHKIAELVQMVGIAD